jgi:hypothetical protein
MGNRDDRTKLLQSLLDERILVLDGAMGTMIQQRNLSAADFGGPALEGCNENLVRTRPDVILDIHRQYYEAGADIVETDTFGGTPLVLNEYGLADKCFELNARRSQAGASSGGGILHAGQAAVRRRVDRADHQGHHGHWRCQFRAVDRAFLSTGAIGLGRRRR